MTDPRRYIPALERLLGAEPIRALEARFGRERTVQRLREAVARARDGSPEDGTRTRLRIPFGTRARWRRP